MKKTKLAISALIILFIITSFVVFTYYKNKPIKIGVLLPLTGEISMDLEQPLRWAQENINSYGGINGKKIELVFKDTNKGEIITLAKEFLKDSSIKVVIGPGTSNNVYKIAPLFIEKKKILISPLATAGDIFRAFGKKDYFWRTSEGDAAQVRTILHIFSEKDVSDIALIYEDTSYGRTFSRWTGFFATELGINLNEIVSFERGAEDVSKIVDKALTSKPEYIITVALAGDAAKIKREMDKRNTNSKLFLTDSSRTHYLINELGKASEGLEGTSPTADPSTGFFIAYKTKFNHTPSDFAAQTYDSFLLALYTLARQENKFFEGIEESIKNVVSARGKNKGWDKQEVFETTSLILKGELPDISGASGSLEFDPDFGVDPLTTFYSHWRIEAGDFRVIEVISSDSHVADEKTAVARTTASTHLCSLKKTEKQKISSKRDELKAVIIATSSLWNEYRHQSDALAMYHMLKSNGMDDEDIILMIYDDVAWDEKNPKKGDVHNIPEGPNLRDGAVIDYKEKDITPETLKNVLLGKKTKKTPVVLESDRNTNVFVYIVDHGIPEKIRFSHRKMLNSSELTDTINLMSSNKRYRQMFMMVDTCYGESMITKLDAPNMVFFTGASKNEPSFGATYDFKIKQWLSDEFTKNAMEIIKANPEISIEELYSKTYGKVTGSHVKLLNYESFEGLETPIKEFIYP